ncbi:MAG TPA: S-layer homology domain-containing protein [Thermomicrobiales bacterium]|jgi:hypothetical protein|nr:S-layer homology domain-containing protein [Thermomicrobiales bacterium]
MTVRLWTSFVWRGALALATLAILLTPLLAAPHGVSAADTWQLGQATQTTTYNCFLGSDEPMGLNWAGYYGEPGVSPTVGQVYYVQALFGITGDPCTPGGVVQVHVEFLLPQGTQPAISAANPVTCIKEDFSTRETTPDTADCPQTPQSGMQGGLAFNPPGGTWPITRGYAWHIMVPVVSSQPLDGLITGSSCPSCLTAALDIIDSNQSWTYPQVGVNVVGQAAPPPSTSPFSDVPTSHPYYQAIVALANQGIIHGYQPVTCQEEHVAYPCFGPDDPIMRAQMAALIARTMGWDQESHGNQFPDRCNAKGCIDNELWREVGTLAYRDVAHGYQDGTYRPFDHVLYAQTISFITRAMEKSGKWQAQADNPSIYPNVPATSGHRADLTTYVHYVGAAPGTTDPKAAWGNWDQPNSRAWFAEALWLAIK